MARKARIRSNTGFYHITNRGVNKADVFLDSEDHRRFIECLNLAHAVCDYQLIAYCIMTNHFHIIIRCDCGDPVPVSLFQSIGARFSAYYHRKYRTAGQIFQGRFKSETIESESHLLSAIRYVWNNPVEAGICNAASAYPWSSFNLLGSKTNVIDNRFLDSIMHAEAWRAFTSQKNHDWHLEPFTARGDDGIARAIIQKTCGQINADILNRMSDKEYRSLIEKCRCYKIGIAQIARITSLPSAKLLRRIRTLRINEEGSYP